MLQAAWDHFQILMQTALGIGILEVDGKQVGYGLHIIPMKPWASFFKM